MKLPMKYLCVVFIAALCAIAARAQITAVPVDNEDFQFWNDLQVSIPLSKRFDLNTGATARIGKNVSRFNEGRFLVGFTWKPNAAFSVQPSYTYISARNTAGRFRIENRFSLRFGYKFPIESFGLTHRSTFEHRIRASGNSWRYRPSLTFDKNLPKRFIPAAKFYVTEEPFYDSISDKFARNRFSVGITKTLTKKLSVDVYFLRQDDHRSHPGDLNVIGATWKVRL